MTTRTPFRLAALAPAAITGILLAGCGSTTASTAGQQTTGGSQPASGGGGSQPASGGGGSQPASGGSSINDGLGHPVSVCSLLPASTVASVSGEPITVATEDDTLGIKLYTCHYKSADGTNGLDVNVLADDASPGYDGSLAAAQTADPGGTLQISGLGDKAFSSILGLEALFGNVSITVSNLQSDQASETLIRDLQPKL
jgi:hypothetical protein